MTEPRECAIEAWSDWPDDVRPILREWNGQRRLSFRGKVAFVCSHCAGKSAGSRYGNAVLDEQVVCDGCLMAAALRAELAAERERRERAERELQAARDELGFHKIPGAKGMCTVCYDAGYTAALNAEGGE